MQPLYAIFVGTSLYAIIACNLCMQSLSAIFVSNPCIQSFYAIYHYNDLIGPYVVGPTTHSDHIKSTGVKFTVTSGFRAYFRFFQMWPNSWDESEEPIRDLLYVRFDFIM